MAKKKRKKRAKLKKRRAKSRKSKKKKISKRKTKKTKKTIIKDSFKQICPIEMLDKLKHPITSKFSVKTAV